MTSKTTSTDYASAVIAIVFALLMALAAGGWIANIVKLFASAGDPVTGWFIVRCLGIVVAPVGAVLGYL